MIAPNTQLKLIKNMPFDNTYEHTVSYANPEAQFADITQGVEGDRVLTIGNVTYQRYGRDKIRIAKPIEEVIKYNYMCYKNTNYENKWIYAFITNIDYVNDNTTEITYEIDVMQTFFLFNTTKEMSFIEREHTATDNIGDNITAEPVELGEYIFDNYDKLTDLFDEMNLVVAVVDVDDEENVDAKVYDNSVSGSTLYAFKVPEVMRTEQGRSGIIGFLNKYIQKPEAITSMYLCPTALIPVIEDDRTNIIADGSKGLVTDIYQYYFTGEDGDGNPLKFGSYVPKNKKMYTYPYNYLHVDNCNGNSLSLRYEFFDGARPSFRIFSNFTYPPTINLVPFNYKGQSNTNTYNRTEKLTISNFPLCSWSNDSYSNWVATETVPLALGAIKPLMQLTSGVITAVAGGALQSSGGLVSGAMNMLNYVTNVMSAKYTASIKADVLRGGSSIGNANVRVNEYTFHYGRCHITEQMARIIDNYFSVFGYAVNKTKHIEYRNRKNWNYVKTINANIHGECADIYTKKMVDILNNGITFWRDSISKVCNYDLDNEPV